MSAMKTYSLAQYNNVSKYLSDISKILFASLVINFFIASDSVHVSIQIFIVGLVGAAATWYLSFRLAK